MNNFENLQCPETCSPLSFSRCPFDCALLLALVETGFWLLMVTAHQQGLSSSCYIETNIWASQCIDLLTDLLIFFFFFFLAALGLRCWAWAFSSCGERGPLFVAVHGLLIAVASPVAEHGL